MGWPLDRDQNIRIVVTVARRASNAGRRDSTNGLGGLCGGIRPFGILRYRKAFPEDIGQIHAALQGFLAERIMEFLRQTHGDRLVELARAPTVTVTHVSTATSRACESPRSSSRPLRLVGLADLERLASLSDAQ